MLNKIIRVTPAVLIVSAAAFVMLSGCSWGKHAPSEVSENAASPISAESAPALSAARSRPEDDALKSGKTPYSKSKSTNPASLGKGINIGNALEAPRGVNWGVTVKTEYFDYIREAGFDTVRLPVRFCDYNDSETYELEAAFMSELDGYIQYALDKGLNLILDFHHFEEIMDEPEKRKDEFIEIWAQLARRYQNYPGGLVFEILNEPKDALKGSVLNSYIAEVIGEIRKTNPDRLIVVGAEHYNSIAGLDTLNIPDDDNIIVTFHYYEPSDFAFQGNQYHEGYEDLEGITWTATEEQMSRLRNDFSRAKSWAEKKDVRMFLGEFGILKTVPVEYRALWIKSVKDMAEEMGFSWCYWELASHFGIFDSETQKWDMDILPLLVG